MSKRGGDERFELIRSCIDGDATAEQFIELERLLLNDADYRREYLRYLNIDSALGRIPKAPEAVQSPSQDLQKLRTFSQWRHFTSAAAGLVIGLFCASMTWAFVLPRNSDVRMVAPVLEESFEDPAIPLFDEFPRRPGEWGGARGKIVSDLPEGAAALDGRLVLRLEPSPDTTLSYIQQVIDVARLPAPKKRETRTVEVTGSFLADQPGERERYTLRVATFKETPEVIRDLWVGVPWQEMDESTLTMTKSGLSTPVNADGWQTISVSVEVPRNARSVVISLAAGRLSHTAPKTPHYLDDVRADLVFTPLKKRARKRIR